MHWVLREIIEKSTIVDSDCRLARPFSCALPFKRPSERSAFKFTLLSSCEAPRIALRTPGDAQGTRVKRIHNSSLIFPHLSRAPLSDATSSLSLSLSLSFCRRAVLPFFSREQSGKKSGGGGIESPFRVQRSHARFPRCQRNIHPRALCAPSRRLTYLLVRSLMQLLSRKISRREREKSKKCGERD